MKNNKPHPHRRRPLLAGHRPSRASVARMSVAATHRVVYEVLDERTLVIRQDLEELTARTERRLEALRQAAIDLGQGYQPLWESLGVASPVEEPEVEPSGLRLVS